MRGMTTRLFTNSLLRRTAAALGDNGSITQAALNNFWLEYGDDSDPPQSNKADKANAMVRIISKKPTADEDLLNLINEAFFLHGNSEWRQREPMFGRLRDALVNAGFEVTYDGFTVPGAAGTTPHPPMTQTPPAPTQATTPVWDTRPQKARTGKTNMSNIREDRSVFIVHGRDHHNLKALRALLRKMDIKPLSWTDAEKHAEAHETLKIVEAGLEVAQAVIVLFTPDDQAMLNPVFHQDNEPIYETRPTGQARPNVILEAGMAYAKNPDRTIFARFGHLRPISDIAGIHFVNLDNEWSSRLSLRNRLINAGVKLDADAELTADDAGKFGPPTS